MPMTKHFRLSLDFVITVADSPPEDDGLNPPDPAYHDRQARLLEAVKNHPRVFTRWLRSLVTDKMMDHHWYSWDTHILGSEIDFKDILTPVLETLPKEDLAYFEDMYHKNHFSDAIDLFLASFAIEEQAAVIVEQSPLGPLFHDGRDARS